MSGGAAHLRISIIFAMYLNYFYSQQTRLVCTTQAYSLLITSGTGALAHVTLKLGLICSPSSNKDLVTSADTPLVCMYCFVSLKNLSNSQIIRAHLKPIADTVTLSIS